MRVRSAKLVVFLLVATGGGCSAAKPNRPPVAVPASFDVSATLTVGQSVRYADGLQVRLEKIGDSRCPKDAVCVWQGELAPLLRLAGGSLSTERELRLGTVTATEGTAGRYSVVLQEATAATATIVVSEQDPSVADCIKTGCSGEVCADKDTPSSCIYRPEFDCYKSATCERQADGKCGWTESAELTSCLESKR